MAISKHRKYDAVIIGGGPNGLLTGAYLARAGLKVCVLEKRMEMGGGLLSEEINFGGYYHNTHAIYMPMIDYAPAIKDLQIETEHMVKFLFPEVQMCMLGGDGSATCLYKDPKRTAESFGRYSKEDAAAYLKLAEKYEGWMRDFLGPYTYVQPQGTLEIAGKMEELEMGREMFEITEMTPKDLVEEWFEHDKVRALMLNAICFWGLDPEQSGLGFLVPLYFNRSYNYRMVERGSHQLAQALIRDILKHQGTLLTVQKIDKIVVDDGQVKSVETADGDIFDADVVISSIDLHQTFLKYVGEDKLPSEFVENVKMWQWEHHSYLSAYLSVNADAPQLKAGAKDPELNKALIYVMGCESVSDYMAHIKAIDDGEVGPVMYASFPTALDPPQVRRGVPVEVQEGSKRILEKRSTCLLQQHVPYDLKKGKPWNKFSVYDKNELGKKMIRKAYEYVANYNEDDVIAFTVSTPYDVENKFSDMVRGSIKQGQYHPLQMGYNRPNPECSQHRSPIKGLYMGGACTYPGGTILLGPGFLAADAVCEDLGIKKWWGVPECVAKARAKGIPL